MRRFLTLGCLLVLALVGLRLLPRVHGAGLPERLSDRDFWRIVTEASEPDGYFRSDNLTSNELGFQYVIPELITRTHGGQAYLGVGPEQNFTYMAALHPSIAIILDVRRGNLLLQLMYKALFELTNDRAEFVAMLFSKPEPQGITARASAAQLFTAFARSTGTEALYIQNLRGIERRLMGTHHLPLSPSDLSGLESVYRTFYRSGFSVRPWPSYDTLMTQNDGLGENRSYLANEASFEWLKDLESRNLVVPVVGDFAGPKAIRAVGAYLRAQGETVAAFYLSNVEQYLYQDGKWAAFCRNVRTLPIDASSTFIRSTRDGGPAIGFRSSLGSIANEVRNCP